MGFWIILAWRKTMSRPEFQKKLKSIAWGLTRMQIWQLAQHFGCRTMEKSCNKHSRRSTQKEVVKCEKFGKWEVLDSIRQKWRYFCKKPTKSSERRFKRGQCGQNNLSFLPFTQTVGPCDPSWTTRMRCRGAAVCDSLRPQTPWHVFALLRRSTKSPLNSHTPQIWCWQNAANSETTATHCKHSAPGLPSWHTAPSRRSFVKALAAWFFVSYWTAFYSCTGHVWLYCYILLLYDRMLYPSTTTCVQSFHWTWPLSVAGAAKLGELARHVPQVWLQMFQTHDI